MFILRLCLFMVLTPVAYSGTHPLLNDREAEKSHFISKKEAAKLSQYDVTAEELTTFYSSAIAGFKLSEPCSTDLVALIDKAKSANDKYADIDLVVFFKLLRSYKIIDDILLDILLKSNQLNNRLLSIDEEVDVVTDEAPSVVTDTSDPIERDRDLKVFEDYIKRKKNKKCIIENAKQISSEMRGKNDKKFNFKKVLAKKVKSGKIQDEIDQDIISELKILAKLDVHNWPLTLNDYIQKIQSLRLQYPLVRVEERSNFITAKSKKKSKISHRQKLLSQYSYFQIILMGNVIKKLKERMDSNHIDILVYRRDEQLLETIPLDPMERYRFAVKILQKEMKELAKNSYFSGKSASYTDLIAAAYETGIVTAVEIDEVAKIEEIWNPKKTFFEKSWTWIKMFGNVATILIPPPFGFIPSIAIVAIEAATKKPEKDEGHTLF